MAKQNINVGTAANDKKGDSLRAAFQKVNANFTELYTELGLVVDANLNLGAFEFAGSTLSTTDSTAIVIDQAATITSNLTVGGDIVPQTALGGDLGSSTLPWRSLYVSNNTIFIGGTAVGLDANGNLTAGGTAVGSAPAWANITGKPTFATVATSGAYADLTGKPTIPTDFKGSVFADDSTLMIDAVDNKIYATELTAGIGNFVNVNSNNVDVENINGLSSQIHLSVGGNTNLVIENNLVTIQNVSLAVAGDITLGGNIRSEGNINIEINLADSTLRRWQFGEDGNLTLPAGGDIKDSTGTSVLGGGGSTLVNGAYTLSLGSTGNTTFPTGLTLAAARGPNTVNFTSGIDKEFQIETQTNTTGRLWQFGTDGALTIPGDIKSNGNINIDINLADSTMRRWQFGEDGYLTLPNGGVIEDHTMSIKLKPSGASSATQALVIYPTAVDGNHIHLTADGGETDLYLGSDSQYVKIDHGGTIVVGTVGASARNWTFGTDGRTTFPDGAVPAHSYGAAGDKLGMVVFDATYIYYCTADYVDNSTNIWKRTAHGAGTW